MSETPRGSDPQPNQAEFKQAAKLDFQLSHLLELVSPAYWRKGNWVPDRQRTGVLEVMANRLQFVAQKVHEIWTEMTTNWGPKIDAISAALEGPHEMAQGSGHATSQEVARVEARLDRLEEAGHARDAVLGEVRENAAQQTALLAQSNEIGQALAESMEEALTSAVQEAIGSTSNPPPHPDSDPAGSQNGNPPPTTTIIVVQEYPMTLIPLLATDYVTADGKPGEAPIQVDLDVLAKKAKAANVSVEDILKKMDVDLDGKKIKDLKDGDIIKINKAQIKAMKRGKRLWLWVGVAAGAGIALGVAATLGIQWYMADGTPVAGTEDAANGAGLRSVG